MMPSRRILIVDDCAEDRGTLRRYLTRDPAYTNILTETESGEAALDACRRGPPDVVLLDYYLPDMTGLDVLVSLRGCAPVVMLTGAGDQEVALQALELGAHDYLDKGDISPSMLSRAITNAVTKERLMRAHGAALDDARTLARENAKLFDEAKRAAAIREKVFSVVVHDLRGPLSVVVLQQRLLERHLLVSQGGEAAALGASLARIGRAAARMRSMIDELLDVGRLQSGRPLDLVLGPTDLVALVREVVEEHRQLAPERVIDLQTEETEMVGLWDGARVERVITNLVSNALKYSDEDRPVTVVVSRERRGDTEEAVVSVRDQGWGIPRADMSQILSWFHRASNAKDRTAGTGVGLASAQLILEQHGGRLCVESEEGVGSTFAARLPLAEIRPV